MLVFDEEKVMFPLEQPIEQSNELTMIYIEHKQLAEACKILFNNMWEQGKDLTEIEIESELDTSNNLLAV